MRIIGGTARKRRIIVPSRGVLRPTTDRVKEALFQLLPEIEDKVFLDLYAGTGNCGLEALSRGAKRVLFVEKDRPLAQSIRKNIDNLGFSNAGSVFIRDAVAALGFFAAEGSLFDVIFADPPYEQGFVHLILRKMTAVKVLAEEGVFVLQHSRREGISDTVEGTLSIVDQRSYGDTVLSFFSNP